MLNKRLLVAASVAGGVALVSVVGIFSIVNMQLSPEELVEVATVKQDIKAGTILKPEMYTYRKIPKSQYIASHVTKQEIDGKLVDPLLGKEALEPLYKDETIVKSRVSGLGSGEDSVSIDLEDSTNMRRMTYTSDGVDNMAGQLRAGDRVDFWLKYELQDSETNDKILVTQKILSAVQILKSYDSNAAEIKDNEIPSTTIELLLTQEQVQHFVQWRSMGTLTLVKVPADADVEAEEEMPITKLSVNDLKWDILSIADGTTLKKDVVKDDSKKDSVGNFEINSGHSVDVDKKEEDEKSNKK